jgi:hypothetical protein
MQAIKNIQPRTGEEKVKKSIKAKLAVEEVCSTL